jgi:hypothetical protein
LFGGEFVADNATKWDMVCPIEADIRCIIVTNLAICGVREPDADILLALLRGCAQDWSPRALEVTLSMSMTVEDPQAFVDDASSKTAVEAGIATAAGVSPDKVVATLSVGSRRLQGSDRRLQQGSVDVSAEIQAENAGAVAALQSSVAGIEPAAMTTSLNDALSSAGLPTVAVASLTATVAEPPVRYVAPEVNDNSDDSFAMKHGLSLFGVAFLVGSISV